MRKSATADLRSGRLEGSVRDVGGLMVRDALLRSAPHYEGESYRPKFLSNFNAKNFLRFLIPARRAALFWARLDPRGPSCRRAWRGSGPAPAGAARCRARGTAWGPASGHS